MEQMSTTLKKALQIDRLKEFLGGLEYKYLIIYAIVGLILGSLFRRLGKYFIFTILVGGLIFYLFHTMNIITFDIFRLKQFVGLGADEPFIQLLRNGLIWIGNNIILSLSCLVGFIIGYKIKY